MKVIQNTPDQFVLEERPWFLAAIIALFAWAVVFGLVTTWAKIELSERTLLAGLATLLLLGAHYFVHWVRAEFDRTTGRIDVFRRGLLYRRHRTYSLRYLNQVLVEERVGEGATYRAVLVFDKAMLAEMEPERRERLERRKSLEHFRAKWESVRVKEMRPNNNVEPVRDLAKIGTALGFRQAAAHEAPLTAYYSSTSDVKGAVTALNQWLGATA